MVGTGRVRGKIPVWNYTFGQIDTSIVVALFTTGVTPREEVMPTVTYARTATVTAANGSKWIVLQRLAGAL